MDTRSSPATPSDRARDSGVCCAAAPAALEAGRTGPEGSQVRPESRVEWVRAQTQAAAEDMSDDAGQLTVPELLFFWSLLVFDCAIWAVVIAALRQ